MRLRRQWTPASKDPNASMLRLVYMQERALQENFKRTHVGFVWQ